MDDDAKVLAEIRERMAASGEPADDMSNDQLRAALRITLMALAQGFAPGSDYRSSASGGTR